MLTLGVAGLAMLASLLTLSGMRLAQLAPVWAMGLTRFHLALLELDSQRRAGSPDNAGFHPGRTWARLDLAGRR